MLFRSPTPATREEAINALSSDKKDLYGVPSKTLEAGHPVGLRLDIPAYSNHGVWVPTVHEQASGFGAGKAIGHESVASVMNPAFGMSDKAALSIASGKPKGTIATIKGEWNPIDNETAVTNAQQYLNHPDWAQVGMDPERHSYFYDRSTMEPITGAEEALQIGPLVLAKKPVYGKKEDFKFDQGGLVHLANGGQPPTAFGIPLSLAEKTTNETATLSPDLEDYYTKNFAENANENKDLNIYDPNFTKGVKGIKLFGRYESSPNLAYFKSGLLDHDPSNIYVGDNVKSKYLPQVVGHEAQHLQENASYWLNREDKTKDSYLQHLDREYAKVNREPLEKQIENNFQNYKKEWESQAHDIPYPDELGHYANDPHLPSFGERLADFVGLEAKLPRGQHIFNTPLGKAVFNTPELQSYYNTYARPLEVKAVPGNSKNSPTADFIRKLQNEAKLHFKNSSESYVDAFLNTIKDTLE